MKNLKMSKISLTNILKKTFKKESPKKKTKKVIKKVAKKIAKVKKVLPKKTVKKVTKKVSAKTKKIENKKVVNNVAETTEVKTDNLRISKSNEVKPEIKKVKKQDTEKKEYKVKDYVVYPKHGVGQITEFKKINIGGIDVETYVIKFEKDKANGMVPVNKQSHLRPLATINQVNKWHGEGVVLIGLHCAHHIIDAQLRQGQAPAHGPAPAPGPLPGGPGQRFEAIGIWGKARALTVRGH